MSIFNDSYPVKASPILTDKVWGLDVAGAANRAFTLQAIFNLVKANLTTGGGDIYNKQEVDALIAPLQTELDDINTDLVDIFSDLSDLETSVSDGETAIVDLQNDVVDLRLKTKTYKCASGSASNEWSKIFETPAFSGVNHYSFNMLYSCGQSDEQYGIYNGRLAVFFKTDATGLVQANEARVIMYDQDIPDGNIVMQQDDNNVVSLWIQSPNTSQRPEFTVPQVGGGTNRNWFINDAPWQSSLPTLTGTGAQYNGVKAVL